VIHGASLVGAFGMGLLGALSPCLAVTIPMTLALAAGTRSPSRAMGLAMGLLLWAGMALALVPLGVGASFLGGALRARPGLLYGALGVLTMLAGLGTLDLIQLPSVRLPMHGRFTGPLGALAAGFAIAFLSSPCSSPLLIAALGLSASGGAISAAAVMLAYSAGHSVPFLLAGASAALVRRLLEDRRLTGSVRIVRIGAGLVLLGLSARFFYLAL